MKVLNRFGGRPSDVLHYFYCADASVAARLAQRLQGWIVSVFPPGDESARRDVHAAQLDVILTQDGYAAI